MFFTAEDERARIRGSVDPLGLLSVWSAFGRQIVCNLTTVSNSVRGFSVLLIGRYLAQELVEQGKVSEDDVLGVFLRFEQIAAYVRANAHKEYGDVRGIERVTRYSRELGGSIPIGDPRQGEILGDQKTYGLWGLFSVAARESGLVPPGPLGLTPAALEFVATQYRPLLQPAWPKLVKLLQRPGGRLELDGRNPVYKAVAAALPTKVDAAERDFYARALRDAALGETSAVRERQAQCAKLFVDLDQLDGWIGRSMLTSLAEGAEARGWKSLEVRLRMILWLESLIAPADRLFGHLCTCNGKRIDVIAADLRERWGTDAVPNLRPEEWDRIGSEFFAAMGDQVGKCAYRVTRAFLAADWIAAIHALLEWNGLVMQGRRGFPWVGVVNDRLDVRYRSEAQLLPSRDELGEIWRNSYFLDSLNSITRQLEVA